MKSEGMNLKEGAAFLGLTEKCLRRRLDRGLIPYRKIGRSILFWRSELEAWRLTLPGIDAKTALENLGHRNGDKA